MHLLISTLIRQVLPVKCEDTALVQFDDGLVRSVVNVLETQRHDQVNLILLDLFLRGHANPFYDWDQLVRVDFRGYVFETVLHEGAVKCIFTAVAPDKVELLLGQYLLTEEKREDSSCSLDHLFMDIASIEVEVYNIGLLERVHKGLHDVVSLLLLYGVFDRRAFLLKSAIAYRVDSWGSIDALLNKLLL